MHVVRDDFYRDLLHGACKYSSKAFCRDRTGGLEYKEIWTAFTHSTGCRVPLWACVSCQDLTSCGGPRNVWEGAFQRQEPISRTTK